MVLQASTAVLQPVSLLSRQVATPVRDFNVAFEQRAVEEWVRVLISYCHVLNCTCWDGVKWPICKRTALLRWVISIAGGLERGVVRDIRGWKLDLRLLFSCDISRRRVRREAVLNVLFFRLINSCRQRIKSGEDMVGDSKGNFGRRSER